MRSRPGSRRSRSRRRRRSTRPPATCTGVYGLNPTLGRIAHDWYWKPSPVSSIWADRRPGARPHARPRRCGRPQRNDPHAGRGAPQAIAGLEQPVLDGAQILPWRNWRRPRHRGGRRRHPQGGNRAAIARRHRVRGGLIGWPIGPICAPCSDRIDHAVAAAPPANARSSADADRRHRCAASPTAASTCSALVRRTELFAASRRRSRHDVHPDAVHVGAAGRGRARPRCAAGGGRRRGRRPALQVDARSLPVRSLRPSGDHPAGRGGGMRRAARRPAGRRLRPGREAAAAARAYEAAIAR